MIYIFKHHVLTKILFLLVTISISLHAMEEEQSLVHKALLDPMYKDDTSNLSVDKVPTYPEYASLANCLRYNHHVRLCKKQFAGTNIFEYILVFTTYGKDSLQWIMPDNVKDQNQVKAAWKELNDALNVIIERAKITTIVFKIQPEDENRLQHIRAFSCLLLVDQIDLMDSVLGKLPIGLEVQYVPDNSETNVVRNFFLYYKVKRVISGSIKVHDDIKIKGLNWTANGWSTIDLQPNNITNEQKKLDLPIISDKKSNYWIWGGGALAIIILGWYWYSTSKVFSLKQRKNYFNSHIIKYI